MAVLSVVGFLPFLVGATLIWLIGAIIRRLYFHPLSKYPGPLWWKLTQWPEARSTWAGRRHLELHLMHEKYGDVVRFGPNKLSFRTVGGVQDIYTDRRANVIKTGWTEACLRTTPGLTTQVIADRQLHAARRKLLNNAFSETALREQEKYVLGTIRDWCGYLAADEPEGKDGEKSTSGHHAWGKERDMCDWAMFLTLDVLGELCFGSRFGAMKQGSCYIMHLLVAGATTFHSVCYMPIRELLYPLLQPARMYVLGKIFRIKLAVDRAQYRMDITKLVEARFALEKAAAGKADEHQRKDFFHYLLHAKDPETGDMYLPKDLVGEGAMLVGAGSDTSSVALSSLFWYVLRDERVYKKLQAEVRGAFDNVEEIRYGTKLSSLHFLRACIDEALRMNPPIPGLLDRLILPGGANIDGHHVPAGITVGVPSYAIHHNEQYFPHSFSYLPERWIAGPESTAVAGFPVTSTSVETAKAAFHPFSSGPRGCVGKNMAYLELLLAIGRVVWSLDMRLKPGDMTGEGGKGKGLGRERSTEYQMEDHFVVVRAGPMVQFKKRDDLSL